MVLLLAGCGDDDCSLGARLGEWVATFTETDGTCGYVPDQRFSVDDPLNDAGCQRLDPDDVSDDQCTLDRHLLCHHDGMTTELTSSTVQDGEALRGDVTWTDREGDGTVICSSRYSVSYRRPPGG